MDINDTRRLRSERNQRNARAIRYAHIYLGDDGEALQKAFRGHTKALEEGINARLSRSFGPQGGRELVFALGSFLEQLDTAHLMAINERMNRK